MMADKVAKRSRPQSKKSIKHLLERQRRARINNSLGELKNLVLSAIHQGNPQADLNGTEKMEKAEILELTVNYIKAIKGHTNSDLDITEVWKSEDKNFLRKRGINCYECYGQDDRKPKVKKSKRNVSDGYFSAYGAGALSPVNSHIAQCSPCNPCLDGKIMCSCYASAMYGLTTPPPSPSIQCNTPYDERTECSVAMTASLSPHSNRTTMTGQVWRPWLK